MAEWIPVEGGFIEADVIRWREGVFSRRGPRGARPLNIGSRLVIAEVLRDDDEEGWVILLIRGCEVISEKHGKAVEVLKKGREVRRARRTIMRGKPERLPWSDEAARAICASQFLGNRKPVSGRRRSRDEES
jgi:hypothetical protein